MKKLASTIITLFAASGIHAGSPLWTFTPMTSTNISLSTNSSATVQYVITNQSAKTHTLEMREIPGVTQVTTGTGVCPDPFTLAGHSSCVLSLQIDGSQVQTGTTNGPVLCDQGNLLQCYKPSASAVLTFDVTQMQSYTVGGAISGLSMGTIVLLNNDGDSLSTSANGSFTFSTPLEDGSSYNVTVGTQPVCQMCYVTNGSGTVSGGNVTNVGVSCSVLLIQGC